MINTQMTEAIDAALYKNWSSEMINAAITKIDAELASTADQTFSKLVTRMVLEGDRDELVAELATRS